MCFVLNGAAVLDSFFFLFFKDKDSFIGLQEFVMRYSKAPEQLQSSSRRIYICHSHAMTSTGHEPATTHTSISQIGHEGEYATCIAASELAWQHTAPQEMTLVFGGFFFGCRSFFIFTSLAKEVMFLVALVCLSVCLFVCEQHYSKSYERIGMKFYGRVLSSTRKN